MESLELTSVGHQKRQWLSGAGVLVSIVDDCGQGNSTNYTSP